MSYVTNVVVTTACGDLIVYDEDEQTSAPPAMEPLGLRRVPEELPGGSKGMECEVYLGGFNYLQVDEMLNAVLSIEWEFRDQVQVFVRDQHDEKFTERRAKVFGRAREQISDGLAAQPILQHVRDDLEDAIDQFFGGSFGGMR